MGNYASKLLSYTNEKECNKQQTTIMNDTRTCTPVLSDKRLLDDPRSVSAGIRRTPIEIKCTQIGISRDTPSAIPKYLQRRQAGFKTYLETNMDTVMPPLTPKKCLPRSMDSDQQSESTEDDSTPNDNVAKGSKVITSIDKERFIILGLDPRSPAADFDRTPILMSRSLALIKARSQENLSRRGSYETDIYNPKNFRQEIGTSLSIPEIRLLSNIASESLKSPLDMKKQDESFSTSQDDSDLSISKSEKEITIMKNLKFTNKMEKLSDKRIVAFENADKNEIEKQDCENIKFNMGMKDDKIKPWHDSLSKENVSGKKNLKELLREEASRENVIITFDKCATNSTSLKLIKIEEDFQKKEDVKGKKKRNAKIEVKHNEEKFFTPENKRTEMHENRTPFGNRSNNGQIQKKPQLSRGKAISIRIPEQENTPPCKTYNGKTRNEIQWDPNSTFLI